MFVVVVEPNDFVATVEKVRPVDTRPLGALDDYWALFTDAELERAAREVVARWATAGYRRRLGPNHVVLEATGPSVSGVRTVVAIYADGRVLVPFSSYEGQNSGIEIPELTSEAFRQEADALFGFNGSERQARTSPGWLTPEKLTALLDFCTRVAAAYARGMKQDIES